MIDSISPKAIILLRQWYFWTREANCKSNYPPVTNLWEKHGLAYELVGVGFDLSCGTKPINVRKWEEAGYQFNKLDDAAKQMILGHVCHEIDIPELSVIFGVGKKKIAAKVLSGLREYESNCFMAGLIKETDEMKKTYLVGAKEISDYLGISKRSVLRFSRMEKNPLPVVQVVKHGGLISKRTMLDEWLKNYSESVQE